MRVCKTFKTIILQSSSGLCYTHVPHSPAPQACSINYIYVINITTSPQVEYLWPPCTFLEPDGAPTVEAVGDAGSAGVVTVVPVTPPPLPPPRLLAPFNPPAFARLAYVDGACACEV